MEYYNEILNEIVEAKRIRIRVGDPKDIEGKTDVGIPLYAIEGLHKNYMAFAQSDMGLVGRFLSEIRSTKIPLGVEFNFKGDPKKYPYNCPVYTIGCIVDNHNLSVAPYNIPIEDGNPFTQRVHKVLTRERALEIIESRKSP